MDDDRKKFGPKGAAGKAPRPAGLAAGQERAGRKRDPERPGAGKGKAGFNPRRTEAADGEGERIAKRLARAGLASRRDAEAPSRRQPA